jgi:predicted esterase
MMSGQKGLVTKNEIPTLEPNGMLSFEFPELPDTLATMLTGERQAPRFTATLPENYSPSGKFPLFVFLLPYGRGEPHSPTREVIGPSDFICVHLPVFKRTVDRNEPWRGLLVSMEDFETLSCAFRVMLGELFAAVSNIDPERSAIGGFSNGGYATAVLLAGQDDFILHHFRSFFFVEGNAPLAANVLHKPSMKRNRYLVMRGDKLAGDPVHEARVHIDRALEYQAKEHSLDFTFAVMHGAAHELPDDYAAQIGRWVRSE